MPCIPGAATAAAVPRTLVLAPPAAIRGGALGVVGLAVPLAAGRPVQAPAPAPSSGGRRRRGSAGAGGGGRQPRGPSTIPIPIPAAASAVLTLTDLAIHIVVPPAPPAPARPAQSVGWVDGGGAVGWVGGGAGSPLFFTAVRIGIVIAVASAHRVWLVRDGDGDGRCRGDGGRRGCGRGGGLSDALLVAARGRVVVGDQHGTVGGDLSRV